jgi:hypothetical protein
MSVSSGSVAATACQPGVEVPGLSATVLTADGSNLLIHVDGYQHGECFPGPFSPPSQRNGELLLEVDGVVVAERPMRNEISSASGRQEEMGVTMAWLSSPVAAGAHQVRTLVQYDDDSPSCTDRTRCIGSATNDALQARMVIVELRP